MFDWIAGIIESLGPAGVTLLTFLEHVFPPIPSEMILPLAGYVAASGTTGVLTLIVAGTIGSLAGSTFWYVIGRRVGERRLRDWIDRHGRWLTLSSHDLERAARWFERRGKFAVLIGRLVPGIRTFVSLPAGFTCMNWGIYLIYSSIGTLAWTAALVYAGVVLKQNFDAVGKYIDIATNVVLVAFAVFMGWRYLKCWRSDLSPVHTKGG